jgi:hypothetical protein
MRGEHRVGRTPEEWAVYTEGARREARFKAAQERIRKIVDAAPPLTYSQLRDLAVLLHPGADDPPEYEPDEEVPADWAGHAEGAET